jgi:hypothetical protein
VQVVATRHGTCGHHQLDGVLDDDGVVQQEAPVVVLQNVALHKLAVAVAVASVRVLQEGGRTAVRQHAYACWLAAWESRAPDC